MPDRTIRHSFKTLISAVCGITLACAAPAFAKAPSGDVVKVRLGGSGSTTRIVIELDKSVAAQLSSDADDAKKTVITLPDVQLDQSMGGPGQGAIADWKLESQLGAVKLKLTYKTGARIYRRFLLPPADGISTYRYVIDVVPNDVQTDAAPAPTPVVTTPTQQVDAILAQAPARSAKKIIVIDAGHGGKDPGAKGSYSWEKDANLAAAKALRDALEKTGRYKVIMTRDTDSFVDLAARVRIARSANADLFISLHSDSGTSSETTGASIYTLSDSGTERAARKALTKGDWSLAESSSSDQIVNRILIDLTQRATKNRSATFAQLVMDHIGDSTPLLKSNLRQAGFVVLLAPDVPAVLLEMGYITNAHDEDMLNDGHHRQVMMGQVAKAIDQYFENDVRYASLVGFR
ncbi:N-acetylmuramoyl-L-alanine amidase family protein [Asticcacaulis solisilvae]|uniref:N-acetylmuramoyl-L-alanine amidase family protein n=1 Tax=Asticcacaulis solisilvae TaxID=1217274 RepID=UPI003FD85E48